MSEAQTKKLTDELKQLEEEFQNVEKAMNTKEVAKL